MGLSNMKYLLSRKLSNEQALGSATGTADRGENRGMPPIAANVATVGHLLRCLLSHFDQQLHDATDSNLFDMFGVF